MENNSKTKFKFSNTKDSKLDKNELKEKENFNIEELKKYYAEFMIKYNNIEKELKNFDVRIVDTNNSKEENLKFLEEIGSNIKDLKEDYKNNASFLVGYDKQNYMNLIEDLNKFYEERKEKLFPKKKFAFSSKSTKTNIEEKSNNKIEAIVTAKDDSNDFMIKDKNNIEKLIITKQEIKNKNNLIIENISNCEIYILHNLKACYLKNISDSKVFIGSVSGGTHITNCNNSSIYLVTHQLRIHQTHKTNFKIIVSSNPIIEDCSELLFSPLNISYSTLEENLESCNIDRSRNKWNSVLDFKWHKKDKSPNFDYKEETEQLELNF